MKKGLLLPLAALLVASVVQESNAQDREFRPRVVIRRAFPAIKNPPHLTREKADQEIDDAELVLGVEIKGEARAYPVNMLNGPRREIINDHLAKRAIAATW